MNHSFFYMYNKNYIDELYNDIKFYNKFIFIIKYLCKCFISITTIKNESIFKKNKNKIVFFVNSKNNLDSLFPVYSQLKNQSAIITNNKKIGHQILPNYISYFHSLRYLIDFLFLIRTSNQHEKKILILFYHDLLLSVGYKKLCSKIINKLNPKAIIFANDHNYHAKVLVEIAKQNNIKSFYIQHSSVYDNVPKLFSTYALLEGKHAEKKYLKSGSDKNKIKLIGIPRYDKYYRIINNDIKIKQIGICTNRSMFKDTIKALVNFIINNYPQIIIIIRPHPSLESIMYYKSFIKNKNINYSNSKKEDSFSFLTKVDAIISGNSSILLESALCNVMPLYYSPDGMKIIYNHDKYDKYDYVKNKVAIPINDNEELGKYLSGEKLINHSVRSAAKFYCDTINSTFDGQSAKLAAEIIKNKI